MQETKDIKSKNTVLQEKTTCQNQEELKKLEETLKNFIAQVEKEDIVTQFEDDVYLVGKQSSQTQKIFFYCFNDGTRLYAGLKENDQKQGLWKEYIIQRFIFSENGYIDGSSKKFNFSYYDKGIRLPLIGNVNQQGQKQGLHVENYGVYDQLTFKGNYENDRRVGKWSIFFQGELCGGGDYDEQGLKNGQWTDVIKHYDNDHQVIFQGQYQNDFRVGTWTFLYRKTPNSPFSRIGGGNYDENGIKVGQWIDIHEDYSNKFQVIYSGEYRNGIRVGIWEIQFRTDHLDSFLSIGGGEYDQNGIKQGQWIDLHTSFQKKCQITQSGEYKDGLHIGKWIYSQQSYFYFDGVQIIGGGNYDENGIKQGQWIDIHDKYSKNCQVTYQGEYKNDTKIGNWKTMLRESSQQQQSLVVGGGNYNDQGKKEGLWIDIHVNFQSNCQVTYTGQYKNGIRTGQWTIKCKDHYSGALFAVGGGNYNETGLKQGQWIDLRDNYQESCQTISSGQYFNGVKIGDWTKSCRDSFRDVFYRIGGGMYDEKGIKIGQWIELHKNFKNNNQLVYSGSYKNGIKNGNWSTLYRNNSQTRFQSHGGGNYDEKQLKTGEWIDLQDDFSEDHQITYSGNYQNGLPCGKWTIQHRTASYKEFKFVAGGNYNDGVKTGRWINFSNHFIDHYVIFEGDYQNGIQIGNWKISHKFCDYIECIGGGDFNEKGQKVGEWTDIHDKFKCKFYVIYTGNYKDGVRTGKWNIQSRKGLGEKFEIVGGGDFDQNGIKQEKWIEIRDDQYFDEIVAHFLYSGIYKNGIQTGKWTVWQTDYPECIVGGYYNLKGVKQGQWSEFHEVASQLQVLISRKNRAHMQSSNNLIYTGEFQNGLRIGNWVITDCHRRYERKIIGGGYYDKQQIKQGQWIDLHEKFQSKYCPIAYSCEYKDGIRIGECKIYNTNNTQKPGECIGGGVYDEKGIKQGLWIEDKFMKWLQYLEQGEYKNGIRIGRWTVSEEDYDKKQKIISGGNYNEDGIKQGQWVDLHDNYSYWRREVFYGEYKNGMRVGKWTSNPCFAHGSEIEGSGNYDEKQMKQGEWIELNAYYRSIPDVYIGEYKNGKRVGQWMSQRWDEKSSWKIYDEDGIEINE